MTNCSYEEYVFNGSIINGNEFHLESAFQVPSIDKSSKISFAIPTYCKISNEQYKITEIGAYAFFYSNFTELFIPSTIKKIEKSAFENMEFLEKIDLSLIKITSLKRYTLYKCYSLSSIILPETLQTIDSMALSYTNLTSISIPRNVKILNETAFSDTKTLTTVIFCGKNDINQQLPNTIKTIYVTSLYQDDSFCFHDINGKCNICTTPKRTCKPKDRQLYFHILSMIFIVL